jgi:hypothetical protein
MTCVTAFEADAPKPLPAERRNSVWWPTNDMSLM